MYDLPRSRPQRPLTALLLGFTCGTGRFQDPLCPPSVRCLGLCSHTSREQLWGSLPRPSPHHLPARDMGLFPPEARQGHALRPGLSPRPVGAGAGHSLGPTTSQGQCPGIAECQGNPGPVSAHLGVSTSLLCTVGCSWGACRVPISGPPCACLWASTGPLPSPSGPSPVESRLGRTLLLWTGCGG